MNISKKELVPAVKAFLDIHYDASKPILLGFSGGPDSLALLHAILEYKKQHPIDLHLAHIDHGWRPESAQEAELLQVMANRIGLPFHLIRIPAERLKGNLEAVCREERLNFFNSLSLKYHFQAVLLAHHSDDQSETVLKGILEGKSLPYLAGMQPIISINGLKLWRPLLGINKKCIMDWLKSQGLKPLEDYTNLDPRFLRGRFRTQIIPALAVDFGKEISETLCHIGSEALELRTYLDDRISIYIEALQVGTMGIALDLSQFHSIPSIEMKYLLRKICERAGFHLNKEIIDVILQHLEANSADKQIIIGKQKIFIDRKRLFFPKREIPTLEGIQLLREGMQACGPWQILVQSSNKSLEMKQISWENAWNGKFEISIPRGEYSIGKASLQGNYQGRNLGKWWTNEKIPAFLRYAIPVLWKENIITHEFLTGKAFHKKSLAEEYLNLSFTLVTIK